jgi:hypothetical protein
MNKYINTKKFAEMNTNRSKQELLQRLTDVGVYSLREDKIDIDVN